MRSDSFGSGPRRFLGLHGWNGNRHTFLPLIDRLPEDVAFRSVDLPGCGDSAPPAQWNLPTIIAEIAAEIKQPTTLVGNCSGAILALLVARTVPARVARVVLIDAFAWWPWYFRVFLAPRFGRYAYYSTFANPAGRWLTNASLRAKRSTGTHLTRGFENVDHESTYRYLTLLQSVQGVGQFADLTMPVDVLYGAKSFAAVRQSAHTWAQLWPRARICELRGAGHLPIVEAAPQVKKILFGGDSCSTQMPAHSLNSVL